MIAMIIAMIAIVFAMVVKKNIHTSQRRCNSNKILKLFVLTSVKIFCLYY